MWLAKVGYERIEETEDPEIAFDRDELIGMIFDYFLIDILVVVLKSYLNTK